MDFVLVDCGNQNRFFWIQKFLCNLQASLHEGQPLAMAIQVIFTNIVVVVLPVLGTRIVGGINIYRVDLPPMGVRQRLQHMEIFAVDHSVVTACRLPAGPCQY